MNVKLTPYIHDVPQCVNVEGLKFTNSVINIVGCVEVELGVLGIGCLTTRLWVTNSLFNKGVPIVLGSHQIKQILAQANINRMNCWQRPWRYIYEGCAEGKCARSQKSCATVDYTLIGVEPHRPTQGVRPKATVTNESQSHLVASSI